MQNSEYIRGLLKYIETNVSDELETGLLSSVGHISRGKLYSDFYSVSGHSVKGYVRKRRLSNALALIKTSGLSLTDIALQCGFSSHQALCRAVRQTLGLTPSEYKKGDAYYFFPPWNGEPLQSVIVAADSIPPALRVIFYHSKFSNIENAAVGTFLQAFPNYGGRIFGRNGEQSGSKFCYELYLTNVDIDQKKLRSCGFEISSAVSCFTSDFAMTTIPNDEQKINAAWNYLYSEWLQNSMFEYTGEPYYEEYILKNGKPAKLKLYLPIKKRGEDVKITIIDNPGYIFITAKANGYGAEESASRKMVGYLTAHCPHIINSSKELYSQKGADAYACGIRIDPEITLTRDDSIERITTDQDNYLVLESSVAGDYDRYAEILLTFARENGMDADPNGIFAVYDVRESYRNPKIKIYCPINMIRMFKFESSEKKK